MQDLDEVRSRIAKRHHNEKQTKVLGDRQFKHLYRFAMVTMSLCICGLGYASYCKQNPQAFKGVKEYLNFSWFESHVLTMIPFFELNQEAQSVGIDVVYESLGEKIYRGSNQEIKALGSGIVTSIDENQIVVSQDNGIDATYGMLSEIQVALYDHISKGEIIAKYDQQFSMTFVKDGEEIPYEKAATQN